MLNTAVLVATVAHLFLVEAFARRVGSIPPDPVTHTLLGTVNSNTRSESLISDVNGNVYVVGYTDAESDSLAGQPVTGHVDALIAKYTSSGALEWLKLLGLPSAITYASDVTLRGSSHRLSSAAQLWQREAGLTTSSGQSDE